jgi:hypothetical protein
VSEFNRGLVDLQDSAFGNVVMAGGPRKYGLVDEDRRTASRSFSIDTIGDFKMLHVTTGVVAAEGSATVYLTRSGNARGENVFTKRPVVSVEYDGNADAGGFVRGQGNEKPASKYIARFRGDIWYDVHWVANTEVLAVTVTNKSGTARDFIVTANGV